MKVKILFTGLMLLSIARIAVSQEAYESCCSDSSFSGLNENEIGRIVIISQDGSGMFKLIFNEGKKHVQVGVSPSLSVTPMIVFPKNLDGASTVFSIDLAVREELAYLNHFDFLYVIIKNGKVENLVHSNEARIFK